MTNNESQPLVWMVTGYRAGERSQIQALAEALGWPFQIKDLRYRKGNYRTSLFRGTGLSEIDPSKSSSLTAPWPDLVISAGMRNEPVCRWIREQSGGRTRIVHIGRPWADPQRFDLVITTPQYRLPERPNVLQNTMTLNRVTESLLYEQMQAWQDRFADLPKPFIGVVLGGNSGPYTLGEKRIEAIAASASQMARERGGSLLVTSSSRTPASVSMAFRRNASVPVYFYDWEKDDSDNPYFAILGICDRLIVTADSIAMLSEACAAGKPLYMAALGSMPGFSMHSSASIATDFSINAWFYSMLMRYGPRRLGRDIRLVHRKLIGEGRAVWLGEQKAGGWPRPSTDDMDRAVQRVQSLFAASSTTA